MLLELLAFSAAQAAANGERFFGYCSTYDREAKSFTYTPLIEVDDRAIDAAQQESVKGSKGAAPRARSISHYGTRDLPAQFANYVKELEWSDKKGFCTFGTTKDQVIERIREIRDTQAGQGRALDFDRLRNWRPGKPAVILSSEPLEEGLRN